MPVTPKSPSDLLKEFNEIWDNSLPYQGPDIDDRWLNEAFASLLVWAADQEMPNKQSYGLAFTAVPAYQRFLKSLAESLRQKDV
jgi:hypothetical protein